LSLAFPLINENEIAMKAKQDNEAGWKTKKGFDNVMKRQNWA
jgi:S-adenosylhomocysteine hydrolase